MKYEDFIKEVVKRGIEAVKRDYKDPGRKSIREGSMAGFTACLGKKPLELLTLLNDANKKSHAETIKDSRNHDAYLYARGFVLEVEWVCNVVSCLLYNEGKPTLIPPTASAMIFASKIVGVKENTHEKNLLKDL